ncbi:MAG: toprim domain-containing protein [Promethearchaeota archaeon]
MKKQHSGNRIYLRMQRKEELEKLFFELSTETDPIIVEGKKDKNALMMGGVKENMIIMLHGQPLLAIEEMLENFDGVIFLFDYDKEGRKILSRIKSYCVEHGVKVNMRYWKQIYQIFNGHINFIEELRKYLDDFT